MFVSTNEVLSNDVGTTNDVFNNDVEHTNDVLNNIRYNK